MRHIMTTGYLALLVAQSILTGGILGWVANDAFKGPETAVEGRGTVAVTEDTPGWRCTRQGNLTCRIDGVLMTSIEDMPSDPFTRCLFLMDIPRRIDPEALTYVDTVCEPIRRQLG